MKHRINIQIRDDIDPARAVALVARVMEMGRVSGEGKYFCCVTSFTDGTVVYTRGPGKAVNSDSFVVYKEKQEVTPVNDTEEHNETEKASTEA